MSHLRLSGVYTITAPSGGQYVGSTRSIYGFAGRWRGHKEALRKQQHDNSILQNAWNKHGADKMTFAVLLVCDPADVLMYEQRAIDVLQPRYNILRRAGNSAGYKHSEETRAGFVAARTGVKLGPHTEDTKRKIRDGNLGKKKPPHTDSWKAEKSISSKAAMTPEARAHLSRLNSGKTLSEEHCKKISEAHRRKGHSFTPAAIEKSAAARRGQKQSEAIKAKRLASYLVTVAKRHAAQKL